MIVHQLCGIVPPKEESSITNEFLTYVQVHNISDQNNLTIQQKKHVQSYILSTVINSKFHFQLLGSN